MKPPSLECWHCVVPAQKSLDDSAPASLDFGLLFRVLSGQLKLKEITGRGDSSQAQQELLGGSGQRQAPTTREPNARVRRVEILRGYWRGYVARP